MRRKKGYLFLIFICFLCLWGTVGMEAAQTKNVAIHACEGIEYNQIMLTVGIFNDSYDQFELYRSTSKNGDYKLLDSLDGSPEWTFSSNVTYPYARGEKGKVFWFKDSDKKVYYLVDGSASFNKTYYYKVRIADFYDETEEWSDIKSAKTLLSAPQLTKCYAATDRSVKLIWTKTGKAQGYQIQRYENKKWVNVKYVKKITYTDSRVKAGKSYRYRIRAYRKAGGKKVYSSYSNIFTVKTKAPTVKGNYSSGTVYGPSLNDSQLRDVRRVVQSFKDNYIKKGMSEYDKVWAAFCYIRANCNYAWRGWQYNGANTAWGALVYGEAQCSGYARGMKALCDAMGISCYYVHANSQASNPSHQWNLVRVDRKWYVLDAQGGFFLVGSKTYQKMVGMKWNTGGLPACSKKDHPQGGFVSSEM